MQKDQHLLFCFVFFSHFNESDGKSLEDKYQGKFPCRSVSFAWSHLHMRESSTGSKVHFVCRLWSDRAIQVALQEGVPKSNTTEEKTGVKMFAGLFIDTSHRLTFPA